MSAFAIGILGNLLAAAIGFFIGRAVERYRATRATQRAAVDREERAQAALAESSAPWLLSYYLGRRRTRDIFVASIGQYRAPLPFLSNPDWQYPRFTPDSISVDATSPSTIAIDDDLVDRRKRLTLDIWDGTLLRVSAVSATSQHPHGITVGTCSYYQYITACGRLEEETYKAVADPKQRTPLRDHFAGDLDTLRRCGLGAHGLGMQVAIITITDGHPHVLLQRRSAATTPYGGALATIPVFACLPFPTHLPHGMDGWFWNFAREFGEELLAMPDLNPRNRVARPDPNWFLNLPGPKALADAQRSGGLTFELLGFGFDALNGEGNLAAVALFDEALDLSRMQANDEVAEVWLEPLDTDRIAEMVINHQFQPGSAFALTLALARYESWRETNATNV